MSEVGPFQFTQHSGHLMSPEEIECESLELNDTIRLEVDGADNLTAFFNHETGDYDCWLGDDRMESYYYDHETHQITPFATNFAEWFEKRFTGYAGV